MVGSVIITHGALAQALLSAAESISGKVEGVSTVSISQSDTTEGLRDVLTKALKNADSGDGVLIFTDMFGGTPTNMALSTFEKGRVEVITGVNLPMVIKYLSHRGEKSLDELSVMLRDYGQRSIVLAGDMLKEKK